MGLLARRVSQTINRLDVLPGRVLVAVSGGVDSIVLLHAMRSIAEDHGLELLVAHVDHGIHPQSGEVARQVEALAKQLGFPYVLGQLRLGPSASETTARAARLKWLEETRQKLGANHTVLAHHADDQVETILMRLLRGSGPAGLAGMPVRRGKLIRPLLRITRRSILRYARQHRLQWWEDPANQDSRHLRSWIRNDLLPLLSHRLPDVSARIRDAGRHAAADRRGWTQVLKQWPGLDYRREAGDHSMNWTVLQGLGISLQVALVQALASRAGVLPGSKRIAAGLRTLRTSQSGAMADMGGGGVLERSFDRLLLRPQAKQVRPDSIALAGTSGQLLWGDFQVRWSAENAPATQPRDGDTAWFIPGTVVIRSWREGDRLFPLGGRGRRLAVRCFQDARVPTSQRAVWPMLEGAGQLAWIPGVCRGDQLVPQAGAPALRIDVARCG